jgi:hypothetical protein
MVRKLNVGCVVGLKVRHMMLGKTRVRYVQERGEGWVRYSYSVSGGFIYTIQSSREARVIEATVGSVYGANSEHSGG